MGFAMLQRIARIKLSNRAMKVTELRSLRVTDLTSEERRVLPLFPMSIAPKQRRLFNQSRSSSFILVIAFEWLRLSFSASRCEIS